MKKEMRRCRHCGCFFQVCNKVKKHEFCNKKGCQKARKREWQREKMHNDANYRQDQKTLRKIGKIIILIIGKITAATMSNTPIETENSNADEIRSEMQNPRWL